MPGRSPTFSWRVLASPAYIAAYGQPETLDDLERHRAVGYLDHRTGRTIEWFFTLAEEDYAIRMKETTVVDDTDAYIQAAIQELGLIRVASYLAGRTCAAAGWLPVWITSLVLYRFRWFIRKTGTFLLRFARFMPGAKWFCSRRPRRPNFAAWLFICAQPARAAETSLCYDHPFAVALKIKLAIDRHLCD